MSITQVSLLGSVLILAIVVMRALGQYRLPRQAFMILWYLASARLLFPWMIPCGFSLYTLIEAKASLPHTALRGIELQATGASSGILDAGVPLVPGISQLPGELWLVIWIAGAAGMGTLFLWLYIGSRRCFAASLPTQNAAALAWLSSHPLRRRLRIRQSDRISAPLTYGVLHPVILLPKSMDHLDGRDLEYILTHEYVHVLRLDALTKLVLAVTVCLHWFNPLVWVMYFLANRDIELLCDEMVIRRCGNRSAYARLLIHLEEQRGAPTAFCSSCSRNTLKTRIGNIMKIRKPTIAVLILTAVLVAGVTTALATSPPQPAAESAGPAEGTGPLETLQETTQSITTTTTPDVEWWTADAYAVWLANEKEELQNLLGSSGWSNTDGAFVWTQERIDAAIALYEDVLTQIKAGVKVSKSVDGDNDCLLLENTSEEAVLLGESTEALEKMLASYAPLGLDYEVSSTDLRMYWQGKPVHSLWDPQIGIWVANNMRGLDLGPDAVDLEAVYADGKLHALQEMDSAPEGSYGYVDIPTCTPMPSGDAGRESQE